MSHWIEPKLDDLSLSDDGKELHAFLYEDFNGAVYVSIKVEDIKKLLNNTKE